MSEKKIIKLSANPEGFAPDELDPEMFEELPRVQNHHGYYSDDSLGLYVGVWDTTDMVEKAGPYGNDEFMFLLEGVAGIKNCKTGEMERATAPDPFLIPRGYVCQWHQQGNLKKFYLMSEHPDEPIPENPACEGILIPGPSDPVQSIDVEALFPVSNHTQEQNQHVNYRSRSGKFSCGSWVSDSYQAGPGPMPCYLFAQVKAGELTLTDQNGNHHNFSKGEVMFVPQDLVCSVEAGPETRLVFARVIG